MKTISELMKEIDKEAVGLQRDLDELEIISNKIWLPSVGVVKLWEIKK